MDAQAESNRAVTSAETEGNVFKMTSYVVHIGLETGECIPRLMRAVYSPDHSVDLCWLSEA